MYIFDDQKLGACFHCKETEIWTPSNPVTNPGAPDSCTSVSYATLSVNEPTLGCDSGFPFLDPLNSAVQGCYSCDVDDMSPTLIFPLSSDKACFGFTEGSGPTSFELGYRVEGEVGLRVGLKNELTFDGGTVDVNYATGVTTTLEPNSDDPTKFKLIASMGEGTPEVSSTTPGMKFTSDAYSEFYGNAALTIKYPDFDADGIPFQAEERIQLIDAASGGEDSGETGPLGEGVDYTRLFLYEFGLDRVILEYIEFPDIPSLLPLPVLEAELDLEINAPPSPEFALDTPAIDIDPLLDALEGIVSNLGWVPIKTFKRPYKGFEVQCLWHKDKPVNNEAFKAILMCIR